jgi:hypothetical protein
MKKCKVCASKFVPRFSSFQKTCENPACIIEFSKAQLQKQNAQVDKQWKRETKAKLMTLSGHIQLCQNVFNTYIRMRDKGKPCISSGRPLVGKYDAGHFYSTGAYPNLRFNEDNVHGQCVHDNRHLHGNLLAYRERLIERIGIAQFNALDALKNVPKHYTIDEVKELVKLYKTKIKQFDNQ